MNSKRYLIVVLYLEGMMKTLTIRTPYKFINNTNHTLYIRTSSEAEYLLSKDTPLMLPLEEMTSVIAFLNTKKTEASSAFALNSLANSLLINNCVILLYIYIYI